MTVVDFMKTDEIRHQFSQAMSAMYQKEGPLYTELIELVNEVNESVMQQQPEIKQQLINTGELDRLGAERHGAIRLGTADELETMRRLFAVMGMFPVGYYDLTPAGVPVHSTAFRAVSTEALNISPFRVFTSLLRLELIEDESLRTKAKQALENRNIFTDRAIELIETFEKQGGLTPEQGEEFVREALETFRWHETSPISKSLYDQLLSQHGLIADIVGFKGPHINHLTPRTLDIDSVQKGMSQRNIPPKDIIEGPPRRNCPILLHQTSFKALEEAVNFTGEAGETVAGTHTARFGEIEQRGVALTPKGRALYDELLNAARAKLGATPNASNADQYYQLLSQEFEAFPDDYHSLHEQGLAYFYYQLNEDAVTDSVSTQQANELVNQGVLRIEPIVYEDFLPVSAAGIFQSNLKEDKQSSYQGNSNQADFEKALGRPVYDELELYRKLQEQSFERCLDTLQRVS
ncbi:2-oxoadipate dioxygenase/decarboxylase HglS [Psychrobacter sanguinis]|uniref:2-oxoadipate dioxygenase/decarboxylase HglS n=1 Tax=Psychrobacter sanguinis TaxID=861445 RepID=UPI001917C2AD|nr:VOC family protein [Psychrobacter sanguinis]MCC3308280.1 VOC family protein [Psychrobacter sanguinis]